MWTLSFGPIPSGMMVCHRCDVRNCVNPKHLFLGTNRDNMADMVRKGRKVRFAARGEKNGNAKWSDKIAHEVSASREPSSYFLKKYGMPRSTVCYLKNRRRELHGKVGSGD
jgi:hypothetical protein